MMGSLRWAKHGATRSRHSQAWMIASANINEVKKSKPRAPAGKIMAHTTWLRRGLVDAPGSPFHALQLDDKERNVKGEIRSRNYSNLFKPQFQVPAQPGQDWAEIYQDPSLPLVVDVGCGSGRCVLLLAHNQRQNPERNFLGLDIHTALMERANIWAQQRHLHHNLHYLVANAAISLPSLLASYPGAVQLVCVQYPDPHVRKQRHVVHEEFVNDMAMLLRPGANVLLQSDLEQTAVHMRDTFERYGNGAFCLDKLHLQEGASFHSTTSPVDESPGTDNHQHGARSQQHSQQPQQQQQQAEHAAGHMAGQAQGARLQYSGGVSVRSNEQGHNMQLVYDQPGHQGAPAPQQHSSSSSTPSPSASTAESAGTMREVPGGATASSDEDDGWRSSWAAGGWLLSNPIGAPTEREVFMDSVTGGQVYRVLLERCS